MPAIFTRPLRVVHWNAQSLRRKKRLLQVFLREQDIDVALISETCLGDGDQFTIPNYVVYRKDERSDHRAYRGLAVIVKRKVVHQPIEFRELASMYALGIEVQVAGTVLRLYAAYKPPQAAFDFRDLRGLLESPSPTIVAGDLNAKHTAWNSSATNAQGRRLFADSVMSHYDVAGPDEPTHYLGDGSGDILDVVVYKGLRTPPRQEVLADLPSDPAPSPRRKTLRA